MQAVQEQVAEKKRRNTGLAANEALANSAPPLRVAQPAEPYPEHIWPETLHRESTSVAEHLSKPFPPNK